jgi:hypothetical protein
MEREASMKFYRFYHKLTVFGLDFDRKDEFTVDHLVSFGRKVGSLPIQTSAL